LHAAYFQGNAPTVDGASGITDTTVFSNETGTVYYQAGTTGWGATFGGWPTALWSNSRPLILDAGHGLGVRSNAFTFTVSGTTNATVIVQTCTNLSPPVWTPIFTNSLSNGVFNFSDADWTNAPQRFYRAVTQ
jgi:hypothetical protein